MAYNVSKVTNDLIVAFNELLDDVQQLIDDRFFELGLNIKVAETLLKPIYSKVEDLADELVLEGGAGEVVSEDIQKLVDDALLESVKSANVDSSDEETIKMLELMKIETEPSNLPAEINQAKYVKLQNAIVAADNLRKLARSFKTSSIVKIEFKIKDDTVLNDVPAEEAPINATFRFSLDINNGEFVGYLDVDYEIDRFTYQVCRIS